jgi:SAM-dependent methyltransferase
MPKRYHHKNINDFTDYRLTGDARITPEATAKQAKCYRRLLIPLGPQSTILDVSCRDGRHTVPLAKFYKMATGVDSNKLLLEEARQASKELKNIRFIEDDVRELQFDENSFDGVLSSFSSWGTYGKREDQKVLNQMVRVLQPGGVFVLDYGNIDARLREIAMNGVYSENLQQQVVHELFETPRGEAVVRTSWVDPGLSYHWLCQRVGYDTPVVVGIQQGYHPDELTAMLREAGLQNIELFGDYDLSPVNDRDNRLIVRAEKAKS